MKRHRMRARANRWLLCAVIGLLGLTVALSVQYRPLMLDSACKLAKNTAQDVINEAVCAMLEEEQTDYEQLMRISCNEAGVITSLQANTAKINRIKAQTVLAVRERLSQIDFQQVSVPLGTLCGATLLSAYGPDIPCRYLLSAMPTVGLEYHFDGAGINQTLHSIIMVVTVPLSVTLPLQSADVEVKTSFIIGETILVGEVPDTYTNVISDPEVADDIFNYGDAG